MHGKKMGVIIKYRLRYGMAPHFCAGKPIAKRVSGALAFQVLAQLMVLLWALQSLKKRATLRIGLWYRYAH